MESIETGTSSISRIDKEEENGYKFYRHHRLLSRTADIRGFAEFFIVYSGVIRRLILDL